MKRSLPFVVLLWSSAVSFGWDLKPDPPAEKPWAVKPGLSIRNPQRTYRVEFADDNGPFALLGDRDKMREVYDLRTGERTARFNSQEDREYHQREHLSPDGKVWATANTYSQLRLVDTATGKQLGAVSLNGPFRSAKFTGPGRIVLTVQEGAGRVARVFSTADAALLDTWPLDTPGDISCSDVTSEFDVSPGGKYLAAIGQKALTVHSLSDGKKLAELAMPAAPAPLGIRPPAVGVAFSADGSELAVLVRGEKEKASTLVVWALNDGARTDSTVERPGPPSDTITPALAPVRSGGWLIDGIQVWVGGKRVRSMSPPAGERRMAVTSELVIGRAWSEDTDDVPVAAIPDTPRPFRPNDLRPEFEATPTPPVKDVPKPANPRVEVFDDWWVWAAVVGGGVLAFSIGLAVVIVLVVSRRKRSAESADDEGVHGSREA